jgi:enoyl-CoA hydratase
MPTPASRLNKTAQRPDPLPCAGFCRAELCPVAIKRFATLTSPKKPNRPDRITPNYRRTDELTANLFPAWITCARNENAANTFPKLWVNPGYFMADTSTQATIANAQTPGNPPVHVALRGASCVITLDRGGALNALNAPMLALLADAYAGVSRDANVYVVVLKSADPKAFSAGGDVVAMSQAYQRDPALVRSWLAAEYALNWRHECFSKPTVALINGVAVGSGVGISAYATHRVAGERYRFAMPETAIGFFPDVGMAHVLARLPHRIGLYIGLTGLAINRADAYALGLVTHALKADTFAEVEEELADAQPVDVVLDSRHEHPGPSTLMAHAELIEACFAGNRVEDIIANLRSQSGPGHEFAEATADTLAKRAPLALQVTLRHITEAAALDLRQTLQVDYRLACRFLADNDFHEGVRAALIDKDHAPRWSPAALVDATRHRVDDYFATMPGEELNLPLRQEMQSMRV